MGHWKVRRRTAGSENARLRGKWTKRQSDGHLSRLVRIVGIVWAVIAGFDWHQSDRNSKRF